MLPKGKFLFGLWLLMLVKSSFSQQQKDSIVIVLPLTEISENRLTGFASGKSSLNLDEATLTSNASRSLTEVLSTNSSVNIRSYGPNGAPSISLRGTNSNHTAILWNGINIQDPLNGVCNTSLIPAFLSDEVQIVSGGISALYGSGSIGGLISLQNTPNFDDKLKVEIINSIGSFSTYSNGLNLHTGSKNISSNLRFFSRSAVNDFEYTNFYEFKDPRMKLSHARFDQKGISQENTWRFNPSTRLNTNVMYQQIFREIPPMMSEEWSNTTQGDKNLRSLIQLSKTGKWMLWDAKSAFLVSEILYDDPDVLIHALHQSFSSVNEIASKINLKSLASLWNIGVNNTFEKVNSTSLQINSDRNRLALFSSLKTKLSSNYEISGNFRDEMVNNALSQPTFGLYFLAKPIKNTYISTSFTRNYRVPTFNELYWKDSHAEGNLGLKDESGYSADLSVEYFFTANKLNNVKLTTYLSRVDNLIQWMYAAKIWRPYNQQQIQNKGIEISLKNSIKTGRFEWKSNAAYEFVSSTLVEKTEELNGRQMIFVPKHTAHLDIRAVYNNVEVFAGQNFMSARSVSYASRDSLPALYLANVGIRFTKKFKSTQLIFGFKINNLMNTEYQLMPGYPNPGRNFEVNFNYIFNLKTKNDE